MQITVINVGYGDAILFQASNGYTILLDGGSALESEFSGYPYRIPAAEYLKAQGITHLDAVIISHIHEDHVCGLESIFEQVSVGQIFVPYPVKPFLQGCELQAGDGAPRSVPLYTKALNVYRKILLEASEKNIPVCQLKPGSVIKATTDFQIRILAPKPDAISDYVEILKEAYAAHEDSAKVTELLGKLDATSNQTSLLLRIEAAGSVFLTAADSCPKDWDKVPSFLLENVNVLKLPHHGQKDAISEYLMRDMPLSYVITTASSDRRYNSANAEVYQKISSWYPEQQIPQFLFSDERNYPPYFSQPEGFQAITLEIDAGTITPAFINLEKYKKKGEER